MARKNKYIIGKDQFDTIFRIGQSVPNKIVNIDTFLIHQVSPLTNDYFFTRRGLSKKFHCAIVTINRALKLLKKDPYLIVGNNTIKYRYIENKEEGNHHA